MLRGKTKAREIYARYRGAADVWAAAPRPLDAPARTTRKLLPLAMESLAWCYSTDPHLRAHLDQEGMGPATWRKLCLEGLPEALQAIFKNHQLGAASPSGPRCQRRWARVWKNGLRQMGLTVGCDPIVARTGPLGNLESWVGARRLGEPPQALCVADEASLSPTMRRLLFVSGPSLISLEQLTEQTGLPPRRIARVWPLAPNFYLPVCRLDRAHLPQALLTFPAGPSTTWIWNTLHGEVKLPKESVAASLFAVPEPPATCSCGLGSWSICCRINGVPGHMLQTIENI